MASLFLWSLPSFANPLVEASNHPEWRALLHIPPGKNQSLITDAQFVAQTNTASFDAINQAHQAIQQNDIAYFCQFPARTVWLSRYLHLDQVFDENKCPELGRYMKSVPIDHVKLVYAYESLSQPASMMGHIFLMLEGENGDHQLTQHAVSFFTNVDGWNVPKLLYDATITGKEGFFALTPYLETLNQYQNTEQRNVLEYTLKSTTEQRERLRLHIWELRSVHWTYFFHRYNCATVTNDLIALLVPNQGTQSTSWLSPLDVVKATKESNLIAKSELIPSDSTRIQLLLDAIEKQSAFPEPHDKTWSETSKFLSKSLELAELHYRKSVLSNTEYQAEKTRIDAKWGDVADHQIQLIGYKDPIKRANDAQINLSLTGIGAQVEWMPISHQLTDDHRHAASESQLRMMSIKTEYDTEQATARVNEVALYDMVTLTPYNSRTKQFSGRFYVGAQTEMSSEWEPVLVGKIDGAIGYTKAWQYGLQTYAMLGLGLSFYDGIKPFLEPELGLIAYEKGNLKTHLSIRERYGHLGLTGTEQHAKLQQSWFVSRDDTVLFELAYIERESQSDTSWTISWRRYF